jgi:hypothetical protein
MISVSHKIIFFSGNIFSRLSYCLYVVHCTVDKAEFLVEIDNETGCIGTWDLIALYL